VRALAVLLFLTLFATCLWFAGIRLPWSSPASRSAAPSLAGANPEPLGHSRAIERTGVEPPPVAPAPAVERDRPPPGLEDQPRPASADFAWKYRQASGPDLERAWVELEDRLAEQRAKLVEARFAGRRFTSQILEPAAAERTERECAERAECDGLVWASRRRPLSTATTPQQQVELDVVFIERLDEPAFYDLFDEVGWLRGEVSLRGLGREY
jgi:hypothetical protein